MNLGALLARQYCEERRAEDPNFRHIKLAADLGLLGVQLSHFLNGRRRPGLRPRLKFWAVCRIPILDWDSPVRGRTEWEDSSGSVVLTAGSEPIPLHSATTHEQSAPRRNGARLARVKNGKAPRARSTGSAVALDREPTLNGNGTRADHFGAAPARRQKKSAKSTGHARSLPRKAEL